MQYGYFDEKAREYVITNPDTPAPWANYLGSPDYGAIITVNAGGYSFVKSGAAGRILRYTFNQFDEPGRYIYLRDEETGDFWSASWKPVKKPLDQYRTECHHGTSYTEFVSEYNGIRSKALYYVPMGATHEVWRTTLENLTDKPRKISVFGYAELTTESFYTQDLVNMQYTQFITRTEFHDDFILEQINEFNYPRPDGTTGRERFFGVAGAPVVSYTGRREQFLGRNRFDAPQAVLDGKCDNSVNYNGNPCGALQVSFALPAGGKGTAAFLLGQKDVFEARKIMDRYAKTEETVNSELEELIRYWHGELENLKISTPDPAFNAMVNTEAAKEQAKIIAPENGYLNNPNHIISDFLTHRYATPHYRKQELDRDGAKWYTEWLKWLHGEPADVSLLNSAYINWLGGYLRFTQTADGRITVERVERSAPEHLPQTGLIGGICGEVFGSKYELEKDKQKVKKLAGKKDMKVLKSMTYTDDTILSLAIAKWLMDDPEHSKDSLIDLFRHFANRYQTYSFGRKFQEWVKSSDRAPYGAGSNGSAMRVAPVAWYAHSLDECLALAKTTAEVTHNSPEGIRGAQAVAAAIYLNRTGSSKDEIRSYISQTFGYNLDRTTDEIRPDYAFETACDKSVPESIICFLEAESFMDAVIRAISLGGDTDTMACIAGNIAAATMPVPEDVALACYNKLPQELREILNKWNT